MPEHDHSPAPGQIRWREYRDGFVLEVFRVTGVEVGDGGQVTSYQGQWHPVPLLGSNVAPHYMQTVLVSDRSRSILVALPHGHSDHGQPDG